MRYRLVLLISIIVIFSSFAQDAEKTIAFNNYKKYSLKAKNIVHPEKEVSILYYREYFSKHGLRRGNGGNDWKKYVELLKDDGSFSDLDDEDAGKSKDGNNANSGGTITDALSRIRDISEAFRVGELAVDKDTGVWDKFQKSILRYGNMEISRSNTWNRFHSSCFAIPQITVNIYFNHLDLMDEVEQGLVEDEQLSATCDMLKTLALQAWTQPFRDDETDDNVVQLDRFRNHVWWVGGNALGYRPLLAVAFMYRSIPMIDLLAEVSQKAISVTSQNTYEDSFWNEGFTADGAGWGHGMQCLVWGYPIDGTLNALNILSMLQGSPWEKQLSRENVDALMNYFRGSNYYYYKGYNLPGLDRYSMKYDSQPSSIRYQGMLNQLLKNWSSSFNQEEFTEIKQLYDEAQNKEIKMESYEVYNGTRWFFNNDDLIKKNDRYHIIVNMSSIRVDGLESAYTFADAYNYYTTDGATMFQKKGDEYRKAFGAYDVTAFPGVTAREGMEYLNPVTNWRGYTSKHNFAAASTNGGENAVAGYIFEKKDASEKKNVNDLGQNRSNDGILYGVKAYKSYFMIGDYMVALGAGITNITPEVSGRIRTTIDQTELVDSLYLYKGKGIEWVVQKGKFAYSALPKYKKKMRYVHEEKATDWIKMNPSNEGNDNLPESVDILRLWIDHGDKPVNDTYGYAVYCGDGLPDQKYPFDVLRNDTLIQAIKSLDGSIVEAVFYDHKSTLKVGKERLKVSAPCTVLIEQVGSEMKISVTDALMDKNCKKIDIMWIGKTFSFDMPQGELCGKPASIIVK